MLRLAQVGDTLGASGVMENRAGLGGADVYTIGAGTLACVDFILSTGMSTTTWTSAASRNIRLESRTSNSGTASSYSITGANSIQIGKANMGDGITYPTQGRL